MTNNNAGRIWIRSLIVLALAGTAGSAVYLAIGRLQVGTRPETVALGIVLIVVGIAALSALLMTADEWLEERRHRESADLAGP